MAAAEQLPRPKPLPLVSETFAESDVTVPIDPGLTGGDAFDLETLGLTRATFVRIRDRSRDGAGNTAGFDLDAVGIVHAD